MAALHDLPEASARPRLAIPRLPLVLGVVYGASALVLAAAEAAARLSDRAVDYFTGDPATAFAYGPCSGLSCYLAGVVSDLGVMGWVACATGCFFVAHLARRFGARGAVSGAFAYAGVLTAVLGLDDVFQLHILVAQLVAGGKVIVYLVYAAAVAGFVVIYRRFLGRTPRWLFLLAVALLGVSAAFDHYAPGFTFVEDGAKLLGIVTWAVYFIGTGLAVVRLEGEADDSAL